MPVTLRNLEMLDDTDRRILSILQEDSRKSFVELAGDVGLSETATRNRVKRLLDAGVIKKFTLRLDFDRIGKSVSSVICIKIGGEIGPIAASGLMDIDAITEIHTVTGEYDLILKVVCESIRNLERVVEKIRAFDFVKGTNTFVVLHTVKDRPVSP